LDRVLWCAASLLWFGAWLSERVSIKIVLLREIIHQLWLPFANLNVALILPLGRAAPFQKVLKENRKK
jgi:hypothetical protein